MKRAQATAEHAAISRIQHDAAIVYAPRPFALVVLVCGLQDAKRGSKLAADITRLLCDASQNPPNDRRAARETPVDFAGRHSATPPEVR